MGPHERMLGGRGVGLMRRPKHDVRDGAAKFDLPSFCRSPGKCRTRNGKWAAIGRDNDKKRRMIYGSNSVKL